MLRKWKGSLLAAALVMASLSLTACGSSVQANGKANSGTGAGPVAISIGGADTGYFGALQNSLVTTFQKAGYNVRYTNAQGDPSKQLADIQGLLAQQPQVLIVNPVEPKPLAPVTTMAKNAHVPLFLVDRTLTQGVPGKDWVTTVGTNFYKSGIAEANSVANYFAAHKANGPVHLLSVAGIPATSVNAEWQSAFNHVFAKHPEIKTLASCNGQFTRDGGRQCVSGFLQRFPKGSVDGIYFGNDEEVVGAIQAIKAAGRTELLGKLWGRDGTRSGMQAVVACDEYWTIRTNPNLGPEVLAAYNKFKKGDKLPGFIDAKTPAFSCATPADRSKARAQLQDMIKSGDDF
jgi:ribose transport system substrate-binding protein